ncbi:Uncharacterized protein Rs2_18692 [Raphanus sativus]|nr:Uncharacterized protein Rs2_18692 [Raphanus sativus]
METQTHTLPLLIVTTLQKLTKKCERCISNTPTDSFEEDRVEDKSVANVYRKPTVYHNLLVSLGLSNKVVSDMNRRRQREEQVRSDTEEDEDDEDEENSASEDRSSTDGEDDEEEDSECSETDEENELLRVMHPTAPSLIYLSTGFNCTRKLEGRSLAHLQGEDSSPFATAIWIFCILTRNPFTMETVEKTKSRLQMLM